jgi:GT2 family glycosyltransferase
MESARLSVVVVSHGRPAALCRCLMALKQQVTTGLEVVVVADAEGLSAIGRLPFADGLKTAEQTEPNISRARNAGLAMAAGELVGFIDDDAVPAPTWAGAVQSAFAADADLFALTGPVLGRNGISMQWGSIDVDTRGRDMESDPDTPIRDGFAQKLHGTNMAFRRDVFDRIGGFDPAFAFYLDDTDLSMRIAKAGLATAWLPTAVVHHGYAASTRRTEDRVPLSLFDIGASTGVFLRKHAPDCDHGTEFEKLEADQRARLLRLARRRKLDSRQMRQLMESLREGIQTGRERAFGTNPVMPTDASFQTLSRAFPKAQKVLSGWRHQAARLRAEAAALVDAGHVVSLFLFEPTPRKHKVVFTDGGWWEQAGGLYGPSDRSGPRLQGWRFENRLVAEIDRIRAERGLGGQY